MKMKDRSDFKQAKNSMRQMKHSSGKWTKFGMLAGIVGMLGTWYAGWKYGVAQTGDALLDNFAEDDDNPQKKQNDDPIETTGETVNNEESES